MKKRNLVPKYLIYFSPLFFLFIYGAFLVTLNIDTNLGAVMRLLLKPIRIIITIMGGFSLAFIISKSNCNRIYQDALTYVFLAILIHAIIMLVQFNNPVFKDWIYRYTFTGEFRSSFDYNFRMGGLSGGSGGAVLSVVQGLGILFIPFLWKDTKVALKLLLVIGGVTIFASVLVCGRSGLWAVIIGLPTILLWQSGFTFYKTIIKFPLFIGLIGVAFYLLLIYYGALNEDSKIFYSLGRTLDVFIGYLRGGEFSNPTVNVLKSHIIFPTDIKTILIGDGEHLLGKQFDRVLHSDIGYIKNIWAFGIIGSIIYWLPLLLLAASILRNQYSILITKPLLMIIILMFVFHLKENFLYVRMFFSMISLMAGVYYIEYTNRINCIRLNNLVKHNF